MPIVLFGLTTTKLNKLYYYYIIRGQTYLELQPVRTTNEAVRGPDN